MYNCLKGYLIQQARRFGPSTHVQIIDNDQNK